MPYYDYKCAKCNKVFEVKKHMNDSQAFDCPDCKIPASRIFNLFSTSNPSKGASSSCSSTCSSSCSSCGGH